MKQRNAAFELLRIAAMLMIVGHHLVYYSGLLNIEPGANRYFAQLLNMGGKLGVNLYVMIGAWFMSEQEYRLKRTARIWLQTLTTGLLILAAVCLIWGADSVGNMPKSIRYALLPFSQGGYWFAGAYMVLTMLSPFLNVLLRSVKRQGIDMMLGVLLFSISLLPTVFIGKTSFFTPVFWFVCLYLLIGRLKRWPVRTLRRWGGRMAAIGIGWIFLSTLAFGWLGERYAVLGNNVNYFGHRMETLPMLLASLGLFMLAVRQKPFSNRGVEYVGRLCFGVYLLHDSDLVRGHIWGEWIRAGALAQSPRLIPWMLLSICMVFGGAALVEAVRMQTIGRLETALLNRLDGVMERVDRLVARSTDGAKEE